MGKLTFQNGDVFEGSFANGTRYGFGTLKTEKGEKFEGFWQNDKLVGLTIRTYIDDEGLTHKLQG